MAQAPVNKIIPLSVVDGPGNRTSIFLQACNIKCAYCHNPETQQLCISCGACVPHCPAKALSMQDGKVVWDDQICEGCDKCIEVCPHFASPKVKLMSAQQVFDQVKGNIPFIRGITVSGGECTLYPEFLKELFALCKAEGLSCLIDSNGMIDLSLYPQLMEFCEGVMLDVKSWDSLTYEKLTGANNAMVKKNLKFLADRNLLTEIRIVCLEGRVDAPEAILGIAQTIGSQLCETVRLKLIKFRHFGVRTELKNAQSPTDEYMQTLKDIAVKSGFGNVLVV